MEKLLLSFSNYLRDIKKIYFVILFLLSSLVGLAQTITTNKTVTANATNCGVINVKLDITGANPPSRESDVILVIDVSGSMGFPIAGDTKTSMDYAKLAAKSFVSQASANTNNRISVVSYTTTAKLEIGLTYLTVAGVNAINAKIDALTATSATNIQDGLVKAETELETNGRFNCETARSIILLTDGVTNRTGPTGSTTCSTSTSSACVTSAITAATNAKTTVKSAITYNNQIFSVGLFGGISGDINTPGTDRYVAKYTLDNIQGSAAYITYNAADLTAIYNQIATQISWVAQSLIEKETIIPGFTIGSITVSKGTTSTAGQVITWNTDFLNSETITLNYQLTPTGSACGNQTVSTSTLTFQNSTCTNDSSTITSPSYFVPCAPVITGNLNACGSTILTATTNAASPTYIWLKDNVVIAGQTASTLTVTASGVYTVKVKNGSTNCELTSAGVTVVISPAAALTAPANATISGCGTNAITGLLYSPTSTTITLAQLNSAGGSLSNSGSIGTYTISYSDTSTGTCPIVVTRTFKVTTGCGNVTANQTITIQDTTAPIWSTAPTALNVTLQCSDTNGLTTAQNQAPVATDNCNGTVTYTKTSGSFVAGNCANSGTYTNTWVAKDVCLNTSTTFTQVITIQDTTAPIWTTAPTALNATLQCSDTNGLTTAQSQAPVATDNCNGTVTYIKTSGSFVTGNCANSGTYTNTWIAKDVCLNTSTTFTQVITIEDTTAPTWTTAPTALNVTLQCSNTAGLATAQSQAPVATDNCNGTVTYTKTSGSFVAGNCANSGTYTNTWVAKDVCLNTSTTFTQVITIEDTTAPTWTTAPTALNITLQCSNTAGLATAQSQAPVATDNCNGTVTYTKTSGSFVAGNCVNSGTYTNTWVAKDVCLNTSTTFTQVITIEDTTAPIWTTAPTALNVTLQCSDVNGLTTAQNQAPVATDNCNGTVTYTKTNGNFVAGNCANSGTYTNTWVAKDVCLNTSTTFTQVITIEDTTAPTWTTAPTALNVTLQCSDANSLTTAQNQAPVATDNCNGTVTYTKTSGVFVVGNCANSGTYTNTWVAKDVCLNTSTTFTQVITIEDTTAPTWTTAPTALNVTLQCSDANGLTTAQNQTPVATDNCNGTVTYTKTSGNFVAGNCVNSGTYTNTWVAKDVCLNTSATFTQIITIEDTTAPIWTTAPTDLNATLECSDTAGLATVQSEAPIATDNCNGTVTYTKTSGSFVAGNCANSGTYTNTWVAKDVCLNTSTTFTQVITIKDTTAPTWTTAATALNVTLQCSDTEGLNNAQSQAPIATDNCSTVTYSKVSGQFQRGSCGSTGTYTNTWTAKDVCNNTSTVFTQVITVQDTAIPIWITQAGSLDVTLQCSDVNGLAEAQNQAPSATANCSIVTYIKTSGQFVANESCSNSGTYTNSWIAKDDCGNITSAFTQVITIEDTTKPTWTTQAGALDVTVQCSDTEALASAQATFPVATDNCDSDVSNIVKTSGQFVANESCRNSGTYTNTWTVKDDCGNTSDTFTQVITIEDTTKPTWTTQAGTLDVTVQCSDREGLATAQNQFPVATDNCDGDVSNIVKTSGQFVANESCSNSGTYTNTWTVKDDCGNTSDTFTQVITIEDTTKPTWTTQAGTLDVTIQCSDREGLATAQNQFPVATDNCDSDVSNIVKTSGQFVASESCSNSGTYTNIWTVKDECGNTSDTFTQVITLEDTTAPTWTTVAGTLDATVQCSDTEGLNNAQGQAPVATDNCSTVTYTKVSGQFQRGSCGSTGTYTNTWTAKDVCNNTSTVFTQVITVHDTAIPIWITQAGSLDITLQCSDVNGLTEAQNQAPSATANCSIVTYIKTSGQFMASESCSNSGTYTNSWIAKDDCGNITSAFTQVITIEDTTKPTWTTQAGTLDVTVQCSDTEALASAQATFPVATDNCDSDVSNIVKISGQFVANESCRNSGTYTNTWTVKDDCGNTSDTFTQVITIEDTTKPTWTTVAGTLDVTIQCSDTEALASAQATFPVATDNCDSDVSNIVKTSGQFMASESCRNSGTYTNTWTVKDECGNTSDTFTQVITIEDTTKPTWTTVAGTLDVTIQCSDTEALASAQATFPVATDNCDGDVSNIVKTSGQFMASESCSNSGTYTNTWTVKDECGNTSDTFTQVITIEDTTKPTWTTQAETLDVTIQCSDTEALASAQATFPVATDNCDGDVSNIIKTSGQFVASQSCSNSGTYTNTWTVKDKCGNTSDTFTQVITLEDTTKPTFTGNLPADITVSCDAVPTPATITASDNCNADNVSIAYLETKSSIENECSTNYILTRKWTASDCSGNTATYTQVITVKDTTAPTGTAPADITGLQNISDVPVASTGAITNAVDNCSQTVNITVSDSNNGGTGCQDSPYIVTRTYTLSDCAGNTTTLVQTITVLRDNQTPVTYNAEACNADTSPVNLFDFLPKNTPPDGTWVNTRDNSTLQGNLLTVFGLALGDYVFEYKILSEACPRSILLNLSVNDKCKVLACETILVHNAFSPNGDSINDRFVIDGIDDTTCYPSNDIEIYNRWGILVFETKNYNNTTNAFDGISRGRTTISQSAGLPSGTYFYILNYTSVDGNGAIQTNRKDGYLYLSK
ncbi:gliding motility-associated C-terminal domain-containing protein [uncultured Flavobacterium sp.]|uniref:T9SS type B sorting domain-containing protein n=1 Tax=uncultured Flavobacterium sp. TaxID=165435 RepID=UPI00292D15F2|nr:gliding motility-associated C-terminal domain-containing protein [uncultured Flavobacterium sp.]